MYQDGKMLIVIFNANTICENLVYCVVVECVCVFLCKRCQCNVCVDRVSVQGCGCGMCLVF